MTILYNTNFTHNPNAYLTIAVQKAAEALFGVENVVVADNRTLIDLVATGRHDTLICIDGQRLSRNLVERVRPAIKTLILWLFEDPFMLTFNQTNTDLFDFIFTNDPSCVDSYSGKGSYLPLAASKSLHQRPVLPDEALENDIFFAGTMWPNRVATLRALLRHFPAKRFKLVCPTNPFLPPLPRDIAKRAIQWPVSHEAFIDFANASRVTLTMFRNYASHGDVSQATGPGPRLFELALAGTAQVVEIDAALPTDAFNVLDAVACYNSVPKLIAGIERLLGNPAERRSQALSAQESAMSDHLYENRLRQIASITAANFTCRPEQIHARDIGGRKIRVLMCTHSTMHQSEWGGVEVYQQMLVSTLKSSIEVFFWLRRDVTCTLMHSDGTVLEEFGVQEIGWLDRLTDAPEEVAFSNVISQYDIDVVHFQHLGHHAASLPIIAKACGAGTIFSAHDFFLVCSRYNLLDFNSAFCDIGNRSITACDICLRVAEQVPVGAQETRRNFMAEMLRSVDLLLFGTSFSEQLSLRVYPALADKRRLIIGVPTSTNVATPLQRPVRNPETPLKVAVVGNFLRSKGADTILRVIEIADSNLFEFYVLGKAEPQYEQVFNNLGLKNLHYQGRYAPGELDAINECDVALHMSIWPETFCISLSEIWQRGLIPIVSDIGAFHDRVSHGENGFLVKVNDAAAVIDYLELLRADPMTLARMRNAVTSALWVNPSSYASSILATYRSVMPHAKLGMTSLDFNSGHMHLLPHDNWRDLAPSRHIFDPSNQSDIALELPMEITDWIDPDDSHAYVESVAGNLVERLGKDPIRSSDRLDIVGWSFVAGMGISGQVFIALIGEGEEQTILLKGERRLRNEISDKIPGAPRNAGFAAQCMLRGKWSDGRYQIGVINVFDKRAAFTMTSVGLQLLNSQVATVWHTSARPRHPLLGGTSLPDNGLERISSAVSATTRLIEPRQFKSEMPIQHNSYHETDFKGAPGHLIYGPYTALAVGHFQASFNLELTGSRMGLKKIRVTLDVSRDTSNIVASRRLFATDLKALPPEGVSLSFVNNDPSAIYEFRVHVSGQPLFQTGLRFSGVKLEQIDSKSGAVASKKADTKSILQRAGLISAESLET